MKTSPMTSPYAQAPEMGSRGAEVTSSARGGGGGGGVDADVAASPYYTPTPPRSVLGERMHYGPEQKKTQDR